MKKEFKKFMKEIGAWEKFKDNLPRGFKRLSENVPAEKYISSWFLWCETDEGWHYWSLVQNLWEKHMEENCLFGNPSHGG